MATGKIEIVPPLGGLDRRWAYQQQPPFTTPDAKNVRPRGTSERRNRMGSRPGADRSFWEQLGGGIPVRLLNECHVSGLDGFSIWEDTFDGDQLGGMWTNATSSDILHVQGENTSGTTVAKFIDPRGYIALNGDGAGPTSSATQGYAGLIREVFNINTGADYGVEIYIVPDQGAYQAPNGVTYRLFTRLNNTSPNIASAGWFLELTLFPQGPYDWRLVEIHSGGTAVVRASNSGDSGWAAPGMLRLQHLTGNAVFASWRSDVLVNTTVSPTVTPAGNRVAFSIDNRWGYSNRVALVDTFRIRRYLADQSNSRNSILIASANGLVYRETPLGRLEQKNSGSGTLASDRTLQSAEHQQKLYIADVGEILDSTTGVLNAGPSVGNERDLTDTNIPLWTNPGTWAASHTYAGNSTIKPTSSNGRAYYTSAGGNSGLTEPAWTTVLGSTQPTDGTISDWVCVENTFKTSGDLTNDYVVEIYDTSNDALIGAWPINSLQTSNTEIRLDTSRFPGTSTTLTNVGYRIVRAPKVYTPNATPTSDTLGIWAADVGKGTVPAGCPLICTYRDRVVLAGAPRAPHIWYMSRSGDALDWDYGVLGDDQGRAIAGQNSNAGTVGQPIRALMTSGDDYMLFGCLSSLWILRGDPAMDGRIDNLSREVGVVGPFAWCNGPEGETIFLSRDGLYYVPPGGGFPQSLSRERLPDELLNIDIGTIQAHLSYDRKERGIHIFLTHDVLGESASATQGYSIGRRHWWFDWQERAFWPVTVPSSFEPTAVHSYSGATDEMSAVLIGGRDGLVRRFDKNHDRDESTTIDSYVLIGPISLGGTDGEGLLSEISALLGSYSSNVSWSVFVGDDNELAAKSTSAVGTARIWTAGINTRTHPRARGASMVIKVSRSGNYAWVLEKIYATIASVGRQRKLASSPGAF